MKSNGDSEHELQSHDLYHSIHSEDELQGRRDHVLQQQQDRRGTHKKKIEITSSVAKHEPKKNQRNFPPGPREAQLALPTLTTKKQSKTIKTKKQPDKDKKKETPEKIVPIEIDDTTKVKTPRKQIVKEVMMKNKKSKYATKEIAEEIGREYVLLITLRDTIYFLIFGILVTIVCISMVDTSMYNMTKVMREQLLDLNYFEKVNSAAKFWTYLENLFDKSFYWDYWYYPDFNIMPTNEDDRNILYENKLLGIPRIRQLKIHSSSCHVHDYFKSMFRVCYGEFDEQHEDVSSFGPETGTAWTHSSAKVTGNSRLWGSFAWYHGGGFYTDLPRKREETLKIITDLRNNMWITRGTRVVILDFAVYNANSNLFCNVRISFEFPPTGGVVPKADFKTVKLIRYYSTADYFCFGCEIALIGFVFYYAFEELWEIIYFKWSYLLHFWSYIDVLIIACGLSSFALGVMRIFVVKWKLDNLKNNEYPNLENVANMQSYFNYLIGIKLFCIYIKLFKYLNFNKSMAQLNNTLKKCRRDVSGFALMFFIIFIAFAVLGYLLFGTQVLGFRSFYVAMFTLLRTILGDFDYIGIETANRVLAPIFFLCFIFLVFFILLNMFLAIINDTYTDVKTEIAIAPDELQMTGFLRRGYYNFMLKIGCGKMVKLKALQKNEFGITTGEIRGALKRIGFTDMEIEMFFQRFNLDADAEVQDYDIEKLIQALEGKSDPTVPPSDVPRKSNVDGKPLVAIDDFAEQQEQLRQIESSIISLEKTLEILLDRLAALETIRKLNAKMEESNQNKNKKV